MHDLIVFHDQPQLDNALRISLPFSLRFGPKHFAYITDTHLLILR